ncbi:MAG: UDP-N-acetyl glucosamine 2-epimerase [Herpetosiphonaceae bacterium]|nr:MAG: UDP-N-acetyl glucosamine 2-epimerase [Herpetosiphonaceae bacterium]
MKIVTVVGARPQFIKAAAVSRILRSTPGLNEILVHTGQHYDENMSDVFFEELNIPRPDYHLGIGSGSHGAQTGRMLEAIEQVLLAERPNWVLVYGDTNSTLAGALAAAKLHIPVAHVEAGLRSFNRKMPEEINRVLTDHAADLLFAPTEAAVENLRREGIPGERVIFVGDVMYDAALYFGTRAEQRSDVLARLGLKAQNYVLATIHRAENTDNADRLRDIVSGLVDLAHDIAVVLPLHPRTRGALQREGLLDKAIGPICLIDPVGYLDMIMLEKHARLIITDSGGVQKEAFFYRVPCITLRNETEWTELVTLGWNQLCPPAQFAALGRTVLHVHNCSAAVDSQPYGSGNAGVLIVSALQKQTQ